MKTIDTLDQLIAANQAVKANRTPSLDAALANLINAKTAMADHATTLAQLEKQQGADIAARQAEIDALKASVTSEQAAAQL